MRSTSLSFLFIVVAGVLILGSSCARKSGCPSGGVGAERLLSGEKMKKQKKFRA